MDDEEDIIMMDYHPYTATSHPSNLLTNCLHGPQVIDVIMRKPEFSFLIRYYNLLYQSLIPNCKLTIKTLKQHIEIPSDVESFVVNGESSRIRCQRIINLLLVQLDTTSDYKHFCYLFNMISVMTDLPDKLRTAFAESHDNRSDVQSTTYKAHPSTTKSINQLDNYAVDNTIIQCDDDGPSDNRAGSCSISSPHQVVGRRRCRTITTTTIAQCVSLEEPPSASSVSGSSVGLVVKSLSLTSTLQVISTSSSLVVTQSNTNSYVVTSTTTQLQMYSQSITTTAFSHHESAVEEIEPPRNIVLNKDFTQLKTRYHSILQLMPDNYEQSVGMLLNYISDDQICMILSSSNSTTANKIILDCLIERMSCREELLDLCDQLETITASQQLKMMINEIRSDAQKSSQFPTFTTNIQSLSSNQQHYSTSPGLNSPLYQMTFSDMKLDSSSKILPVLKKNYARLCHCLPQDYVKTVHKLKQLIPEVSADYLAWLRTLPSTDLINEAIIGNVMCAIRADYGVFEFCDVIENLCDEVTSRNLIGALRNEFLEALCSPPPTTTTTNTLLPNNGVNSSSGSHHPITLHQTSNNSSLRVEPTPVVSTSTPSQPNQSFDSSRAALQEQLNYQHQRLERGIKCPPPPTLPPNYVPRQHLLEEMVSKLCQSTIDPNNCGTSLTVTGAGGFGKTSIITALCHHPVIKEQFRDGIVFIELGPQATDPSMKLSQIYHLLTDQYLQQGDVNHAEQEINQLTSLYCRNLLVIIDDVWHFEDAEPIVKAFSNCKIVLTTRMNDIEQYIPTKQVVSVGPMEQSEAISLLTCGVIDISQLSQEDVRLLDELAQDVNLWPLLLSLIRGQLSHNLKHHKLCYHEVIQLVQANLRDKGLTAFDKNNIGRSRKYAAKLCIEVTLQLLTESLSNRLKSLLLWTGIGTSVQTAVLHSLWKIAEYEARNDVDVLWAYGLVQFTNSIIPPHNNTQHCVEIHVVISQYIIECMYSNEVRMLSPYGRLGTHESVRLKSLELFQISSGIYDVSLLCGRDYLKYKVSEIENHFLPYSLKRINMFTIVEPHNVIVILQKLQYALMNSPNITAFFPSLTDEIESLISESHKILHDAHKMSRPLNQNVQRCLTQRNYHNLIQTIKMYVKQYPIPMLAQQAVFMVNKIIPYCDGELLENIMWGYKYLQTMTPDYHYITLMTLPYLELRTEHLQRLYASIQPGSLDMESTQHYFKSRQHIKEIDSVDKNYLNELKKIHSEITNLHIIQSSKT